jgi:hypothetical protein
MKLEFGRNLVGKCGIYCGACRLFTLKKCKGCLNLYANAEAKCPYYKCVENKELSSCGECKEFPCKKHYGSMAVYAKMFLEWKKQEMAKP